MGAAIKYLLVLGCAALTTVGLLFIMQALISMGITEIKKSEALRIGDVLMPARELELIQTEVKPEKPEEPDQMPSTLAPPKVTIPRHDPSGVGIAPVKVSADIKLGGIGLGASDGDYMPIVKVAPIYPSRALSRGIEGYVIVEFTVTKSGTVQDPFVVEGFASSGRPTTLFNSAAIKAALKFKYKPKVINGEPVDVAGVQNKITFKIIK